MPLEANWPCPGGHNLTLKYIEQLQTTFSLEPFMWISPNLTGMIPWWSPTKIVQMVLIGCVSRSRGQKLVFYCNFQKTSCLQLQGPELSYLVYNIIKRSSTKDIKIMPLGFSINGSTVTFDLFLRWATQGPLVTLKALWIWAPHSTIWATLATNMWVKSRKCVFFFLNCLSGSLTCLDFQESYMRLVQCQCFGATVNTRQCAQMLQNLPYADMLTVLMTKVRTCLTLTCSRSLLPR